MTMRAAGRLGREEPGEELIRPGGVADVDDQDGRVDHELRPAAAGPQDRVEVGERLSRLLGEARADRLPTLRVDPRLPRHI
jgi:hypothetical protein